MNHHRVDASLATVRRQFDRRAARFAGHDAIVREVGRRMIERLGCMRHTPATLLDLGCGPGGCRAALLQQFPAARWLGMDLSAHMLRADPGWGRWARLGRWFGTPPPWQVCASAEHLPLADASVDLVFSNLMLHWHPAPHEVIAEMARVLKTGGLAMFSSYGPDTAKELRAACQSNLRAVHPLPCVDMHDFGDMLVDAGFDAPVMEVEQLQLSYSSARALVAEARALGGNPRRDRGAGLPSGARARALLQQLRASAPADGRPVLHFEVVIGHGWKAPPRRAGLATIAMPRPR